MFNRIASIIVVLSTFAAADVLLVKVDLTPERLTPFAQDNIVIAELENTALVLVDDQQIDKVSGHSYEVLEKQPQEGDYYLVRLVDPDIDLQFYGDILMKDGDDYLIKIDQTRLETLIRQKVMVRRISFTPMIIKSEITPPQPLPSNATVQEIVDFVDPDSVLSHVQRMQDFVSRYSTFDSCFAAADWIAEKFTDYGCDSVFVQNHTVGHAPNVIGVKRGHVYPDSIYVIVCGHFDATSDQAPWIAPGADDNASGTAMTIEAARILQDYEFEYSIRFIGFSGEEWGLYGSEYYAQGARLHGDSILAVFNADMIAYTDALPESVEVIAKITNPACEPLADFFIAAADTYTTLLTHKVMTAWMPYSDHAPFWDYGYQALCNIEDFPVMNPYYHETSDTIGAGYNNNDFCTEVIKAHLAALSLKAVPYDVGVDEYALENSREQKLMLSPTVAHSYVTILTPADVEGDVAIYDASGQFVRSFDHKLTSFASSITWYLDDHAGHALPAGVYFVQFRTADKNQTAKVTLVK